jgi:hypothetical protein
VATSRAVSFGDHARDVLNAAHLSDTHSVGRSRAEKRSSLPRLVVMDELGMGLLGSTEELAESRPERR